MNIKKMLYAWVAGAAGMLILGILWHTVIMGGFYDTHLAAVARDVPKMPFVILGYLVLALLMGTVSVFVRSVMAVSRPLKTGKQETDSAMEVSGSAAEVSRSALIPGGGENTSS